MKKTSLKILILIAFLFCGYLVRAQKNILNQNLLWLRYNLNIKIGSNYQIRQELEERSYWFPWRQHQFVARTMVDRQIGKGWGVGVGLAIFNQSLPQDALATIESNQLELRPLFEITNKQSVTTRLTIQHRYWNEFRFFQQNDKSFDFSNIRMRYRLELKFSITKKVSLIAFEEIHLNVGSKIVSNVFDQNRIGLSCQYMPIEALGFELGYFNWFQERPSGIDFYNRNIIRFTIHHRIGLFQKSKS